MRRGSLGTRWYWEAGAGIGLVRKAYDSEFDKRGDVRGLPSNILIKSSRARPTSAICRQGPIRDAVSTFQEISQPTR